MTRLMTVMTTSSSITVNPWPLGAESVLVMTQTGNVPAPLSIPHARLRHSPQAAVERRKRGSEHRRGNGRCEDAPAPDEPPHLPSFARRRNRADPGG